MHSLAGGLSAADARSAATLLLAASEGAVVICRAEQDIGPFELVAAQLIEHVRGLVCVVVVVRSQMTVAGPVGFDLDLTLINSRPAIMAAWSAVAEELGVAIDLAEVDTRMGIKLEDEVGYWFPADGQQAAADSYRRHYVRLAPTMTFPLPGAAEALAAVRQAGERAVIITAKHPISVQPSLDAVGAGGRRDIHARARAGESGRAGPHRRRGLRRRHASRHGRRPRWGSARRLACRPGSFDAAELRRVRRTGRSRLAAGVSVVVCRLSQCRDSR